MKGCTKANGLMIKDMGKATKCLPMEMYTMARTNLVSHMGKEYTHGRMERFMMASGIWELRTVTEFGEELLETRILDNGLMGKHLGTVCMFGRTKISLKANG